MNTRIFHTITGNLLKAVALVVPLGQAQAFMLDNWNDIDLDASGDYISVATGVVSDGGSGYDSWFSMQWLAGPGNGLDALGIDTVFYNCENCGSSFGGVQSVWVDAIGTGTDVTSDWNTNFGGSNAGGGFGSFTSRKNLDAGGTSGIAPDILYFVLNDEVTFANNGAPELATFAAHVRYEENCSGWVSDGNTESTDSGSCGTTKVPEPGTLMLVGLGLYLMGFARRFRHAV